MGKLTKILALGLTALSLTGCFEDKPKAIPDVKTCAETPIWAEGGVSKIPGDFNEDGHLDYIISGAKVGDSCVAQSYLWLGDGKGNFTLKTYPVATTETGNSTNLESK